MVWFVNFSSKLFPILVPSSNQNDEVGHKGDIFYKESDDWYLFDTISASSIKNK